jgi:hypothetical protein
MMLLLLLLFLLLLRVGAVKNVTDLCHGLLRCTHLSTPPRLKNKCITTTSTTQFSSLPSCLQLFLLLLLLLLLAIVTHMTTFLPCFFRIVHLPRIPHQKS